MCSRRLTLFFYHPPWQSIIPSPYRSYLLFLAGQTFPLWESCLLLLLVQVNRSRYLLIGCPILRLLVKSLERKNQESCQDSSRLLGKKNQESCQEKSRLFVRS